MEENKVLTPEEVPAEAKEEAGLDADGDDEGKEVDESGEDII